MRMFLEDGSGDLNIYGGDWWMANQEMERALVFAGYEVNHVWGEGGHSGEAATQDVSRRHALAVEGLAGGNQDRRRLAATASHADSRRRLETGGRGLQVHRRARPSTPGARSSSTTSPTARPTRSAWTARCSLFVSKTRQRRRAGLRSRRPAVRGGRRRQQILAYDADGQAHRDCRRLPRQRSGRCSRRRHVRHPSRLERHRAEQDLVHQPEGGKESRRQRVEVLERHHDFARPVDALRRRQPHALGLQLPDAAGRRRWPTSSAIFTCTCPTRPTTAAPTALRVDRDGRLYVATRLGIQVCDQAGRVNCDRADAQRQGLEFRASAAKISTRCTRLAATESTAAN